jgi:cytosol alanyl aminopeptidase
MKRIRAIAIVALVASCGGAEPRPALPKDGDKVPVQPTAPDARRPAPQPPGLRLPGDVVPRAYALELELDADKETVAGTIVIDAEVKKPTDYVWLHAEDLDISKATWGDAELAKPIAGEGVIGFALPAKAQPGETKLALTFTGKAAARQMEGLFRQQDGGKWYLYSQFEAMAARRAFPCFDEPSYKVPWTVTLIVPKGQNGYGNAPVVKETATADGRRRLELAPTPPIPSYLVAVAVGPFEEVDAGTVGRNKLPARIIVPAGRTGEAKAAVEYMPKIVAALEDYFDMPLPFDKVDSIAVPDFFGAMENPGLITYASNILLAKPEHDNDRFRQRLVAIAAHELGHQWFGDYVTLAWWDDLWLNESFATWIAEKIARNLLPAWDRDAHRIEGANQAMLADARANASPLHRPITEAKQIEGTFDAIAYEKGGAVLTMFEGWIGEEAFRNGVRGYMKKHARGNATSADFLAALEGASDKDVGAAFRTYLEQPGVPLVHAELACAKGKPATVTLTQERLVGFGETAPATLWPIKACIRTDAKQPPTCTTFSTAEAQLSLPGTSCPAWITANADGSGYYRVDYAGDLRGRLSKHLRKVPAVERMAFAADLVALVGAGKTRAGDALALVQPLLKTKDEHDLASAVGLVGATEDLVDDATLPAWRKWVIARLGAAAHKAPLVPPANETPSEREGRVDLLKVVGVVARDPKLAAKAKKLIGPWLAGKGDAPRDLELLLSLAARSNDAKLFDAIVAKAKASGDDRQAREALLASLGHFTDPALVDRAQGVIVSGDFDIFEAGAILRTQISSPDTGRALGAFIRKAWDQILPMLPGIAHPYMIYMQGRVCDATGRDEVDAFVRPRLPQISNGEKALTDTLQDIDACIARRAALAGDVAVIVKGTRPGR